MFLFLLLVMVYIYIQMNMIWLYLSLVFHCTYLSTPAGQQQCKPGDLLLSDSTKPPNSVPSNAMSLPKRRKLPWARHEESAGDCFQTEVYKYVKIFQVLHSFYLLQGSDVPKPTVEPLAERPKAAPPEPTESEASPAARTAVPEAWKR